MAEELVAEHTGLHPPGHVRAVVLDRREWVDSNLASMRNLLDPLMQRFGERMAHNPFAPIGRRVAATELGALLGYVAQRVLGQYDLLVPDDRGEAVYYVGANVLGLEKRFAFRPRDFRLWIAIHEVTHRAQFVGVPWMREYFLGARAPGVRARRSRPAHARARALERGRGDPPRPEPARRGRPRRRSSPRPSSAACSARCRR